MADFDYDALSDLTLTLEAEDGSEVNLEMLYIFEYDDVDYAAFTEQDNPEPVIYFFTLTIGEPAEGEEEAEITFECVEDETLEMNFWQSSRNWLMQRQKKAMVSRSRQKTMTTKKQRMRTTANGISLSIRSWMTN